MNLGRPATSTAWARRSISLLVGKPPFERDDLGEMLQRVQRGEFPRPRELNRSLPAALEAICLRAMALKPADRYPSARALADDIEHWLADERVAAYREIVQRACRPLGPHAPHGRFCRRRADHHDTRCPRRRPGRGFCRAKGNGAATPACRTQLAKRKPKPLRAKEATERQRAGRATQVGRRGERPSQLHRLLGAHPGRRRVVGRQSSPSRLRPSGRLSGRIAGLGTRIPHCEIQPGVYVPPWTRGSGTSVAFSPDGKRIVSGS